jgi:phosphoglycolate phosphatase
MKSSHIEARLLVFDWDGTLMDSEAQIVSCLQAASRDFDLEYRDEAACRDIIGLGLREAVSRLYPDSNDDFVARYTERYRHYWFASEDSRLFPGARETLENLHAEGYLLAVATGKGRAGLDKVLEATGLGELFAATRCADETCSKPDPRMLRELMTELKTTPGETLMVGDTEYDMEMASSAGAGPVAVSYGVHAPERLLRHEPLACLNAISEFGPWLAKHRGHDLESNPYEAYR